MSYDPGDHAEPKNFAPASIVAGCGAALLAFVWTGNWVEAGRLGLLSGLIAAVYIKRRAS